MWLCSVSEVYVCNLIPLSYAPWCPACQQLQPVWKEFADWGEDMGVNIAKVDVTEQPGRPDWPSPSWQLRYESQPSKITVLLSQQVCFQSLYILVVNTKLLVTWCWFVYNEFLILAEPQSDTAAVYLQLVTWHCLKDLYELEPVKARYVIIVVLVPQSLLAVLQCSLSSTKSNSFYLKSHTLSCILNTLLSSLSKDWVGDSLSLHFLLFTSKFLVIFWFLLLPVLCGWHVTSFKDRMSLLMTRSSSCSLSSLSAVEPVNCFHCCLDKMNLFLEFFGSFFASLIISSLFHLSVNQNKLKVTPTIVEVIFILQMHM